MTSPWALCVATEPDSDGAGSPKPAARTHGAVSIDIDAGSSYWRQPECTATSELVFLFHEWEPAVRVGIHAFLAYPGCEFDSIAPSIEAAYQRVRGDSRIPWNRAEPAARRIWRKLRGIERRDGAMTGTDAPARSRAEA